MSKSLIDRFVDDYGREFDYYQTAARLCSERCETLLAARGIRAMVTYRAKRPAKLAAKLAQRAKVKRYRTSTQIRNDIADLAGVRIALYFPGDRERVGTIMRDGFKVETVRHFPILTRRRAEKRFDGYHADHYRLSLESSSMDDSKKSYSDAPIEVQVGSVLMHAWAEVEHDLIYKPESGDLSEDEHAILDELNGLVLAGEISLERLQRAVERRLSHSNVGFDSHFDLAAYLYKRFPHGGADGSRMGRVDVLWGLLKQAKLATAAGLEPFIETLGEEPDVAPIADRIADSILAEHPNLYQEYLSLQTNFASAGFYQTSTRDTSRSSSIGNFLSTWIILERTLSILAAGTPALGAEKGHRPLFSRLSTLAAEIGLSKEVRYLLERARIFRNQLVHGIEMPPEDILNQEARRLQLVLHELSEHPKPEVRAAYEEARAPLNRSLAAAPASAKVGGRKALR